MIDRRTAQGAIGRVVTALLFVFVMNQAQSQTGADKVLTPVADVPMPGPPVRFDYQSLDASNGRLYIAHMNADQLVVFDTGKREVVANLDGFKRVHGVFAAPKIHRLFASATGTHQVIAVDTRTLKIVGAAGRITYPDGLAYVPGQKKVFVSDEHGGLDAVIDATTMKLVARIPLGGDAGNTVYDPISGHVLVAVHGVNMLAVIDPATNKILGRYPLPGIENPHGIALDVADRVAFIAGEENHSLAVVDLNSFTMLSSYQVGDDPDVLAFDPGLKRLYVAAESGTVTIFQYAGRKLNLLGTLDMPHAHTVAVNPRTHLVYFPLQDIDGHPILRIMRPSDRK
jgi:DNA-binding beta-propeller fold protein YncE